MSNPSGRHLSRRTLVRTGLALIPTAAGLSVLAGCSNNPGASPSSQGMQSAKYMTALGLNLSFVETMVAKERGFFDKHGVDIEIIGGQGTATAIQAVLGGSVNLARTHAINSIIAVANEGAPLASIATVRQSSQFEVVSLAEKPIENPGQLAGKICGIVSAGGSTENLLDVMLHGAGVDRASVQRPVTGIGTAAFELAKRGEIDAWISVNTDRATVAQDLGDIHYFNTDEYATIPSDSYNTTQEMIESGSDMPARFLAGVLDAMDYMLDEGNWDQVMEDLRKYNPDVEAAVNKAQMPLLIEGYMARGKENLLDLNDDVWGQAQDNLEAVGLIDKTVPIEQIRYKGFLEQAREMVGA